VLIRGVAHRFRDLASYELTAALADDLYREVRRFPRAERDVIGLDLVEFPAMIGGLIARATAFELDEDVRAHLVLVGCAMETLRYLLGQAEESGLLEDDLRDRVDAIDTALRQEFPDAVIPPLPPAGP
jgi:hypothetical protein